MMKKIVFVFAFLLCAHAAIAASYGILVNGNMYYAGTANPTPQDPSFNEVMVLGVSLKAGDYCQLYDADNKAAWIVNLDSYSTKDISRGNGSYAIGKDACYDFYIKLKWEEDQLYVGGDASCSGIKGTDITTADPTPIDPPTPVGYTTSAPEKCPDVIFQAFYWDSYNTSSTSEYGRTKWIDYNNAKNGTSAEEIGQWFDLIWLPPFSLSTGGTGYLPVNYSNLNTDWGQRSSLETLIETLHKNGARIVADMVVNHFAATSGWCTYAKQDFGTYGVFRPDGSWICSTDEMNYSSEAGDCKGSAKGNADDGYGDEANYASGRDWDHKSQKVRDMFNAYARWLHNVVKVDGFRYDYCKGFHNSHVDEYNRAGEAYFSVMEMWDGNVNTLQSHLNDAKWNTLTFDFALKYTAFNDGIAAGNYGNLKGAGLPGAGKARYAVTFLDSHDSFQRDNNEFCGLGNSMKYPGKIQQCYAYLLSMPGVPLVFYPHWIKFKDQLKPMINARYKTGVHSESAVSDEAGNGYYKATITGTNGQIRVLIGPNSGYNSTPDGFTLAVKGENYGVYYKENNPRGNKPDHRVDRTQGIEEVIGDEVPAKGEKFIENGKLYIRCGEQIFDAMGRRVK